MSSDQSGNGTYLDPLTSVQFWSWVVVFSVGFTAAILALEAFEASTMVVFLAGIIFWELTDRVFDYFTDWYMAEKKGKELTA